jgi:hypothetical protein
MALGATRLVKHTQYRVQEEKACPLCGRHFWGAPVRRYCGRRCQNQTNWRRHAARYNQRRRKASPPTATEGRKQ